MNGRKIWLGNGLASWMKLDPPPDPSVFLRQRVGAPVRRKVVGWENVRKSINQMKWKILRKKGHLLHRVTLASLNRLLLTMSTKMIHQLIHLKAKTLERQDSKKQNPSSYVVFTITVSWVKLNVGTLSWKNQGRDNDGYVITHLTTPIEWYYNTKSEP